MIERILYERNPDDGLIIDPLGIDAIKPSGMVIETEEEECNDCDADL